MTGGSGASYGGGYSPPLQVVGFIATRKGDAERGPQIRMRSDEARERLLIDGELCRIYGVRHREHATLRIDDTLPRGGIVLRDVAGISPSEVVRVVKLDLDRPVRGHFA